MKRNVLFMDQLYTDKVMSLLKIDQVIKFISGLE